MFSPARSHANIRDNDADDADADNGGERRTARKKGGRERDGHGPEPSPRYVSPGHAHPSPHLAHGSKARACQPVS